MSSEPSLQALHAVVRGRVQGVGFRNFVQTEARTLGVTGWVRNGADGMTVELHAEGSPEALEALRTCIARGPALARVDAVEIDPAKPAGAAVFEIRF